MLRWISVVGGCTAYLLLSVVLGTAPVMAQEADAPLDDESAEDAPVEEPSLIDAPSEGEVSDPGEEIPGDIPVESDSDWTFGVEILTEVPLQIGAGVIIEGPKRVRIHSTFGYFPQSYLSATNDLLVALFENSGYDRLTAEIIESALANSLEWRTRVGWRPIPSRGFYFVGGYGLVFLGGDLTPAEVIEDAYGEEAPEAPMGSGRGYDVGATVHMLDIEVGWEWIFAERFTLRTALGGAFTVASKSTADARYDARAEGLVNAFEEGAADWLDDQIQSYVHTPYITIAVGYRF